MVFDSDLLFHFTAQSNGGGRTLSASYGLWQDKQDDFQGMTPDRLVVTRNTEGFTAPEKGYRDLLRDELARSFGSDAAYRGDLDEYLMYDELSPQGAFDTFADLLPTLDITGSEPRYSLPGFYDAVVADLSRNYARGTDAAVRFGVDGETDPGQLRTRINDQLSSRPRGQRLLAPTDAVMDALTIEPVHDCQQVYSLGHTRDQHYTLSIKPPEIGYLRRTLARNL